MQHLARGADDLVDRLDHVHRDADRAGLVRDGAGDGLPDPPRGIGGELVAAPVLELVHGLHEADIAFLDQVQELQAAVRVLLGDGDDEAQVGLHHFLLRLPGFLLAPLHHLHDLAEFQDFETRLGREIVDVRAQVPDAVLLGRNEALPALGAELGHAQNPFRVQLVALILLQEVVAATP